MNKETPKTFNLSMLDDITAVGQIKPAFLEEWYNNLSKLDSTAHAQSLLNFLKKINGFSLKDSQRLALLDDLKPILNYSFQSLYQVYGQQEIIDEINLPQLELNYQLNYEMIKGYKRVIEDVSKRFFVSNKILLSAMYSAFYHASQVIFKAYEYRRRPPAGIWHELHQLYLNALKKNLTQKDLESNDSSRAHTLEYFYYQALLFSIANPHYLRHDQLLNLTYALEKWAPLLVTTHDKEDGKPLFVVDLQSDSGPKNVLLALNTPKAPLYLKLDKITERLFRLVSLYDAPHNDNLKKNFMTSELTLPKNFLSALLNNWSQLSARSHERQKVQGHVSVCLGISSSHWFIEQKLSSPLVMEEDSANIIVSEVIDIDLLPNTSGASNEHKSIQHQRFVCELIDQSEGGCCLKWLNTVIPQLQCGEIITLEKELENGDIIWHVGNVRWIKHDQDNSILLGVQLLGLEAAAVKARIKGATYKVPTLLLPENPMGKPMTLITPPLPFKIGQEIEIEYNNQTFVASLQKVFNISPSFQEFGLEFMEKALIFPKKLSVEQSSQLLL